MAHTALETVSPEPSALSPAALVALLLDKAILSLEEAIGAMECNDIETRCNTINLVSEIVTTLHLGLDLEQGGDVAERLAAIYRFCLAQLIRVNLTGDEALARSLIEVLQPLQNAWYEVDRRMQGGAALGELEPVILGGLEATHSPLAALQAL